MPKQPRRTRMQVSEASRRQDSEETKALGIDASAASDWKTQDLYAKRRRGRPRTQAKLGVKSTIAVRVSADLKTYLDNGAKANGRSLSQQAEILLEQSRRSGEQLFNTLDVVYGQDISGLLILFGAVMKSIGPIAYFSDTHSLDGPEIKWMDNPYAFDQALNCVSLIFEAFRPPKDRKMKVICPLLVRDKWAVTWRGAYFSRF